MGRSNYGSIELKIKRLRFFSEGDETAFFDWLRSLSSVESIEGRGPTLFVKVNYSAVDEEGLRKLLALFHRYGIDMQQFIAFDSDEFSDWFGSPDSYWYNSVFESNEKK